MKRIIIALILVAVGILFTTAAISQERALEYIKTELADATYGLHLASIHDQNNNTNNGNLGVYIRTKSGWSFGHYHNSCNTYTNYYGWSTPEWYRVTLTPVIASGYHCLTTGVEEGKRWSFSVVPSVRVLSFDNIGGMRRTSLRAVVSPGLFHLMAEAKF